MFYRLKSLILFSSLSCCFYGISQQEANIWYFGNKAGLDFNTNPPTILTNGAMNAGEACASVSDRNGNLLFYTNATTIWNKNHQVMANGSGIQGQQTASQGALIVKQPGNSNIYFVFTHEANWGALRYSIVDMSLAAGDGSVTLKNIFVFSPASEKLAGVRHCNGIDTWVMAHDSINQFKAYLVTAGGLISTPVISAIGLNYEYGASYQGNIKFSQDGKKMATADRAVDTTYHPYFPGAFELFDFDNSTGVVSNALVLAKGYPLYSGAYGCEFSKDGKMLYGTRVSTTNLILQWNLCASSPSAVAASIYVVANPSISTGGLQLANNGKIYISDISSNNLSVINQPSITGSACGYSYQSQGLLAKTAGIGLPNIVAGILRPTLNFVSSATCTALNFNPPVDPNIGCGPPSNSVTGLLWNFGDPASGAANSSSVSSPFHQFGLAGTYTVTLILQRACGSDTIRQSVVANSVSLSVNGNTTLCSGQSVTLFASGANSYTWTKPGGLLALSPSCTFTGSVAGTFTFNIQGENAGCAESKTLNFVVQSCEGIQRFDQNMIVAELFPKPCNGHITLIVDEELDMEILDLSGRKLLQTKVYGTRNEFDLTGASPGLYTIELKKSTGGQSYREKFVIYSQ
jgi:hypothetical protein